MCIKFEAMKGNKNSHVKLLLTAHLSQQWHPAETFLKAQFISLISDSQRCGYKPQYAQKLQTPQQIVSVITIITAKVCIIPPPAAAKLAPRRCQSTLEHWAELPRYVIHDFVSNTKFILYYLRLITIICVYEYLFMYLFIIALLRAFTYG